MRITLSLLLFVLLLVPVRAQVYFGYTAGGNYGFTYYEQRNYLSDNSYTQTPGYGYQAGFFLYRQVTKSWGLQLEVNYSTHRRTILREGTDYVSDLQEQAYLYVPLLFRFNLGKKGWHIFAQGGPQLSYYLFNRGTFSSGVLRKGIIEDFAESKGNEGADILAYTYHTGRESTFSSNILQIEHFNPIKLGFDLGIGAVIFLNPQNFVSLECRYNHTQSHLAENTTNNIAAAKALLQGFKPNYEGGNHSVRVSLSYGFSLGNAKRR